MTEASHNVLLASHDLTKCIFPNFLVIGAAKAGTTSLHKYLAQHPEIFVPPLKKEPQFFLVWNNDDQQRQYLKEGYPEFNEIDTFQKYSNLFHPGIDKVRGESSPQYLAYPGVAKKIHNLVPDIKIIVILRDPAERAFSQYQMMKRRKREFASFATAIQEEMANGRTGLPFDQRYLQWGRYAEQMHEYYRLFPASQISVHLFEELVTSTHIFLKNIFCFLNVDDQFMPSNLNVFNASTFNRFEGYPLVNKQLNRCEKWYRRKGNLQMVAAIKKLRYYKLKFPEHLRPILQEYYLDDLQQLEKMIQIDLSAWMK